MTQPVIDPAIALMKSQRFDEALPVLHRVIDQDPSHWNAWYLAGQCCRFLNDVDGSVKHLSRAVELKSDEPAIFLALGIAFQLSTQWGNAVEAFHRAIEIDPDYELAYNSLALTQKKRGQLDEALCTYDAGAKAMARRIVKALRNDRTSPIFKHRDWGRALWLEYALYAAMYLASMSEGIDSVTWPTGNQAAEEERTEEHGGLYWIDVASDKGETVRLFLPNYFNTFQGAVKRDVTYSNLIGNRGTVLELLGRHDEAQEHFGEATDFEPLG